MKSFTIKNIIKALETLPVKDAVFHNDDGETTPVIEVEEIDKLIKGIKKYYNIR